MHSRRAAAGLMDIPGVYEVLHMNYYDSMQELIGNTPLVKINNIELHENVNIFANL